MGLIDIKGIQHEYEVTGLNYQYFELFITVIDTELPEDEEPKTGYLSGYYSINRDNEIRFEDIDDEDLGIFDYLEEDLIDLCLTYAN